MAIDRFDKETFEAALPKHKETGEPLWGYSGLIEREHTYFLDVRPGVKILIRSSLKSDDVAAESGKDSIRSWLADDDGKPLGNKVKSHVSRVNGWQRRMTEVLRELYKRAYEAGDCPTCGKPMSCFKTKKPGPNKGRLFFKCWQHGHFRWQGEEAKDYSEKKAAQEAPALELPTEEKIVDALNWLPTKTSRVDWMRKTVNNDEGFAVWALLKIFDYQTADEQASEHTYYHNKVGFSGVDAELLTSFAKQWLKKNRLSPKQMALLQKKIGKYSKQLVLHTCAA